MHWSDVIGAFLRGRGAQVVHQPLHYFDSSEATRQVQDGRAFRGGMLGVAFRVLQKIFQAIEVASSSSVVRCCRSASRHGRGRDAAARDQPLEAVQLPVASGEVDGRGTEVVSLVENSQLPIGCGQTLSVTELGSMDGRLCCMLAVAADI